MNPKCANCGEEMIQTHTRVGLPIYICPHVKPKQLGDKLYSGVAIYCEKKEA